MHLFSLHEELSLLEELDPGPRRITTDALRPDAFARFLCGHAPWKPCFRCVLIPIRSGKKLQKPFTRS